MKEKLDGLYLVKVNWYDDYKDETRDSCALVLAGSYTEACEKVVSDFQYVNKVEIEEFVSADYVNMNCIYIPNDNQLIERIKEENDF